MKEKERKRLVHEAAAATLERARLWAEEKERRLAVHEAAAATLEQARRRPRGGRGRRGGRAGRLGSPLALFVAALVVHSGSGMLAMLVFLVTFHFSLCSFLSFTGP